MLPVHFPFHPEYDQTFQPHRFQRSAQRTVTGPMGREILKLRNRRPTDNTRQNYYFRLL